MTTFITTLDATGTGPRLAVKDLLDVAGVPTTGGSRIWSTIGAGAEPATADALCVARARSVGARIVGKVNMHELAYGATGVNPWFGTPRNPLGEGLVPGGSSSGSAVVVAEGAADVALGSDTGGSVRIPAACCGVVGLKTTWGRIPLAGCLPLATSLDTIGPLARDVAGVALGMSLIEPGFAVAVDGPGVVGRVRGHAEVDPRIDAAVTETLAATGWTVVDVTLPRWPDVDRAARRLSAWEAFSSLGWLLDAGTDDVHLGEDVADRVRGAAALTSAKVAAARATAEAFKVDLRAAFRDVDLLALPTLASFTPATEGEQTSLDLTTLTRAINAAGCPAITLPIPATGSRLPASLQLVAPWYGEELLCRAGAQAEAAAGSLR